MNINKDTPVSLSTLFILLLAVAVTTQSRAESNTAISWGDRTDVPGDAKNLRAISAGWEHTLAIAADGSLLDWGNDSEAPPSGLTNVIGVAAGWRHNLAILSDGTLVTWGASAWRVPIPDGLSNIVAVSANGDSDGAQSLALARDGSVFSWGEVSDVPENLTNAIAIAAGGWHDVALRSDGTVVAWGDDTFGQTDLPDGLTNVIAIASGDWHSLALKADGTIVSWGLPGVGDLPLPDRRRTNRRSFGFNKCYSNLGRCRPCRGDHNSVADFVAHMQRFSPCDSFPHFFRSIVRSRILNEHKHAGLGTPSGPNRRDGR